MSRFRPTGRDTDFLLPPSAQEWLPEALLARYKAITQAKAQIEARAKERYDRKKAECDARVAAREAKEAETGKKTRGKKPTPPVDAPRPEDQINLTGKRYSGRGDEVYAQDPGG